MGGGLEGRLKHLRTIIKNKVWKKIKVIPEIVLDEGNNKVEATRPNYIYKIPFKDKAPEGSLIMRF